MSRRKLYRREPVKRGRRLLGHFYRFEDGRIVYLANRKHKHIYRRGKAWISHAMQADVAYWTVEMSVLHRARREGLTMIGVRCADTGAIWLTALARFFDGGLATTGRRFNGEETRALPLSAFRKKEGRIKL